MRRVLELYLRGLNTLQRPVFDKCLGLDSDQRGAVLCVYRSAGHRHRPANAMPQGDKVFNLQRCFEVGEAILGLVANESAGAVFRDKHRTGRNPTGRRR